MILIQNLLYMVTLEKWIKTNLGHLKHVGPDLSNFFTLIRGYVAQNTPHDLICENLQHYDNINETFDG